MPAGKTVKIGVWENSKFIGVVIFALGANAAIQKMYGKTCELARVALAKHITPVTKIISIAIKMLKKKCPDLDTIISYADKDQGHEGIIYKAGNWENEGITKAKWIELRGIKTHPRSINAKYGTHSIAWLKKHIDPNAKYIETAGKIRFKMSLTKRGTSKDNVASGFQSEERGVIPTVPLQKNKL